MLFQSLVADTDYENLVLTKLRQAEERKRLTQEILAQDKLDEESSCSTSTDRPNLTDDDTGSKGAIPLADLTR